MLKVVGSIVLAVVAISAAATGDVESKTLSSRTLLTSWSNNNDHRDYDRGNDYIHNYRGSWSNDNYRGNDYQNNGYKNNNGYDYGKGYVQGYQRGNNYGYDGKYNNNYNKGDNGKYNNNKGYKSGNNKGYGDKGYNGRRRLIEITVNDKYCVDYSGERDWVAPYSGEYTYEGLVNDKPSYVMTTCNNNDGVWQYNNVGGCYSDQILQSNANGQWEFTALNREGVDSFCVSNTASLPDDCNSWGAPEWDLREPKYVKTCGDPITIEYDIQ